jgi:hypothetical protein
MFAKVYERVSHPLCNQPTMNALFKSIEKPPNAMLGYIPDQPFILNRS